MLVCLSGRGPIQSGRCLFVCPDELTYNQAGFESLAGSVLEADQYNQAYELMNELHTIKQDRYITCSQERGVHTCTSYVAKKVLCYKMIHVSLLRVIWGLRVLLYGGHLLPFWLSSGSLLASWGVPYWLPSWGSLSSSWMSSGALFAVGGIGKRTIARVSLCSSCGRLIIWC